MTWASSNTFAARRWQSFSWYPGPKRLSNSSSAVTEINENVAEATTLVSTEACKLLSICCTIVEAGTGLELHKLLVCRINTLKVYLDWRAAWKIWQGSNLEEPSLPLSTLHCTAKTALLIVILGFNAADAWLFVAFAPVLHSEVFVWSFLGSGVSLNFVIA